MSQFIHGFGKQKSGYVNSDVGRCGCCNEWVTLALSVPWGAL